MQQDLPLELYEMAADEVKFVAPLSQGFGYGIVIGLGFAFSLVMIFITWALKRYGLTLIISSQDMC